MMAMGGPGNYEMFGPRIWHMRSQRNGWFPETRDPSLKIPIISLGFRV